MKKIFLLAITIVLFIGALTYFQGQKLTPAPLTTERYETKAELVNPASENCFKKGGTLSIQTNGNGGQYGLCTFEDDMACEEWALFREHCPVGGVKTTGFDTTAQRYCAWIGGSTLAVENAVCTMPDGQTCPVATLYNNGTCQ